MAYAQPRIPAEALQTEAEYQLLLEKGARLESENRWGEALTYYEDAVKEYPQRRDLQERLSRARVHYDLARRYQDTTFTASLDSMTEAEALDVYQDVLRKIETHYVRTPDWQDVAERGVLNLEIAVMQSVFQRQNSLQRSDEQIVAFRREMRKQIAAMNVQNRYQARDVAAYFGRLAAQRIGLRSQAAIMEFTCGAIGTLDPYSCFLSSGQLEDVFSQIEGNFVGLGIELKAHEQSLAIVAVIAGSPAAQAGLRRGDKIVRVNDVSTADVSTDEAADMLRGPEGSFVDLTVVGENDQTRRVRVYRRRVEVPSVENAKMLDGDFGIGYMRISSFQKTTSRDMDAALWRLHRAGMQRLVIDLRGNPGGLLSAAVEIADKFLSSGAIVSTRGRNAHEDIDYRAHEPGTWRVPLIVLIDRDSASASEIFAGAIRDHRRGVVIGQRSYGKGSVQGIFSLEHSKAGVRLTTAKFYSPSGQAISQRGVTPDVVVRTVAKPVAEDTAASSKQDAVLDAAIEYARLRLTAR